MGQRRNKTATSTSAANQIHDSMHHPPSTKPRIKQKVKGSKGASVKMFARFIDTKVIHYRETQKNFAQKYNFFQQIPLPFHLVFIHLSTKVQTKKAICNFF
jgi:hypothetical protein